MMSDGVKLASRDALLGRFVRRFKMFEHPRLGWFRLRSVNEAERSRLEASIKDKSGNVSASKSVDLKCRILVLGIDDGEGNQLYTNSDVQELRNQDSADIDALVEAVTDFWGMSSADFADLKKNSNETSADASR